MTCVPFLVSHVRRTWHRSAQTSHVIGYLLLVVVKLVTVRWCGFCMVNDTNGGAPDCGFSCKACAMGCCNTGKCEFSCVLRRCTACVLRVGVYGEVYLDHACNVTCTCVPVIMAIMVCYVWYTYVSYTEPSVKMRNL